MTQIKGSTILVTGAAGFIGSHLVDALLEEGATVIGLDNLSTGTLDNLEDAKNNDAFSFVQGDANSRDDLASLFSQHSIDYVFHYAAVLGVKRVIEQPLLVLDDIQGFKYICELSKEHGVKKVVFASSSEAYGNTKELPLTESNQNVLEGQNHETSLYAMVKLIGEGVMQTYNDKYGLPTCSLRFFNVFGPRQESSAYGFVVGIFLKKVLHNEAPTIFGDGYQTRDFIYIKDNIRLALKALMTPEANGNVINVGVGRQTTILDLAERLIKISGNDLKPEFVEGRTQEIRYRSPDVGKMRKILNEQIEDKLDDNLRETYEWYKQQLDA